MVSPSKLKEKIFRPRRASELMLGLIERGYPLDLVMATLGRGFPRFKASFSRMEAGAREGKPLSALLDKDWKHSPALTIEVVRTGEKHNLVPQALRLGNTLTGDGVISYRGIGFIAYLAIVTAFSILMSIGIGVAMFGFVREMNLMGPASDGWEIPLEPLMSNFGPTLGLVFIALLVIVIAGWRSVRDSDFIESVPLVGGFFRHSRWWRVLYGTGYLMKDGVPVAEAFATMARAVRNKKLQSAAGRVSARVAEGMSPEEALKKETEIPELAELARAFAHDPARVPEMLMGLGEARLGRRRAWLSVAGPVAVSAGIICMVSIFCLFAASMYLPLFTLSEIIK